MTRNTHALTKRRECRAENARRRREAPSERRRNTLLHPEIEWKRENTQNQSRITALGRPGVNTGTRGATQNAPKHLPHRCRTHREEIHTHTRHAYTSMWIAQNHLRIERIENTQTRQRVCSSVFSGKIDPAHRIHS
jgi:hypothetical protein